jgi:hypothetical protein
VTSTAAEYVKQQAKHLRTHLKSDNAADVLMAAYRVRRFRPQFANMPDAELHEHVRVSDSQDVVACELGFVSYRDLVERTKTFHGSSKDLRTGGEVSSESYYTFREREVNADGTVDLVVPFNNPHLYEYAFDYVWDSVEEALAARAENAEAADADLVLVRYRKEREVVLELLGDDLNDDGLQYVVHHATEGEGPLSEPSFSRNEQAAVANAKQEYGASLVRVTVEDLSGREVRLVYESRKG